MHRVAVVSLCVSFIGCGARTGIELGTPDASAATDAFAQDAERDMDAGTHEAEAGVDAAAKACEAALQAGAPTPMPGYCSTRARVSPVAAPSSPKLAWEVPPPVQEPWEVIEMVVDASGRIYASLDTAVSGWVLPDTVVAIDDQGKFLWTQSYADQVPAGLFLDADGDLRFRLNASPPVLAVLGSEGTLKDKLPLPETQRHGFAVGRDGTLYTALWDSTTSTRIAHLAPDGSVLWTSESFERCFVATSPVLLGPDDLAIIGIAASSASDCTNAFVRMLAFDATGATAWTREISGLLVHDPAVGPDGAVRVAHVADAEALMHLVSIDASGKVLWDAELPGTAINVWGSPMVITGEGTTIVRTNGAIAAVSSAGSLVWNAYDNPSIAYGAFADPGGRVVVTNASTVIRRSDTGEQLGLIAEMFGPVVMGGHGSIVGMASGPTGLMSIALARDP